MPVSKLEHTSIKPLANKLGLGASLFLLTTSSFFWFFTFLTVINIPLLVILAQGKVGLNGTSLVNLFSILSYGNFGEQSTPCD